MTDQIMSNVKIHSKEDPNESMESQPEPGVHKLTLKRETWPDKDLSTHIYCN